MPIGILFWMLVILWFIFGMYWSWPGVAGQPGQPSGPAVFYPIGGNILLFILLILLGIGTFGWPIKG